MKKLFLTFIVVFISVILFSCTTDNTDENSDKYENSITNFIKQKYNTENITLGESVEVINQGELYTLKEYFNSQSNSKNYIVTLGNDKVPVYIINYSNNKIKINELISGNIETFNIKSNQTDINLIKLIQNSEENNKSIGRFWGWSCGPAYTLPPNQCYKSCCYYVLGVIVSCGEYPCNNLPGNQQQ